jgi:hypothetical protein
MRYCLMVCYLLMGYGLWVMKSMESEGIALFLDDTTCPSWWTGSFFTNNG